MMKTKAGLLLFALSITACSTDNDPINDVGTPVAARVTAGIGGVTSRAVGNQWGDGDRIGISGAGYVNVPYITDGSGTFSAAGADILFQTPAEVSFKAYYPYDEFGKDLSASTTDQKNQKDFDYLFAEGATASAAKPTLSFNGNHAFRHCMTRLVLKIKTADGFNASDVAKGTYSISGIKHSGKFNTSTGEAVATGDVTDNWEITARALDADGVRTYDIILYPQSGNQLTLKATFDGVTYACPIATSLESGYSNTYEITVKKTGLSISNCTIDQWGEATHTGEATIIIPPIGDKAMELADVGDFYFSDGSFADKGTDLTQKQANACIGIVFYKGPHDKDGSDYSDSGIKQPQCNGYVVALTDAGSLKWSSELNETGVSTDDTDWNGYFNQKKLEAIGIDKYPAAESCKLYGYASDVRYAAPDGSSGWFLPSAGQLRYLYENSNSLSSSMNKCNEQSGDNRICWFGAGWLYWSSSELPYSSDGAWCMNFESGRTRTTHKIDIRPVRAILAF